MKVITESRQAPFDNDYLMKVITESCQAPFDNDFI
jgi:hypothetical protein